MKRIVLVLLFFALPASAQTPMRSFAYMSRPVECSYRDSFQRTDLMPLDGQENYFAPPAHPGAGQFPIGDFSIRKVCIGHWIDGNRSSSYAVVGHSGPNGDHISPMMSGPGAICTDYPADAPVVFTDGEYLDIHAGCQGNSHWVHMQIWYTKP